MPPSVSPRRPNTASNSHATPRITPGQKGGSGSKYSGPLPPGWTQRESRTNPGMFYFTTPDGPTWKLPTENEITPSPRRGKEPKKSVYQKDFLSWENAADFNPKELEEGGKANASYALHPKAKKDPSYFVSINRQDYVAHKSVPSAPSNRFPSFKVTPFEGNSTYRADFINGRSAARPKGTRAHTPPKSQHFTHNSTSRADFVNFKPKRPVIVQPVHKLHFNAGGPVNSTYRQDFIKQVDVSDKSPRFKSDPGWSKGMNKDDGDTYKSLYGTDFIEGKEIVQESVLRESSVIDRNIVTRCNMYSEFQDME